MRTAEDAGDAEEIGEEILAIITTEDTEGHGGRTFVFLLRPRHPLRF